MVCEFRTSGSFVTLLLLFFTSFQVSTICESWGARVPLPVAFRFCGVSGVEASATVAHGGVPGAQPLWLPTMSRACTCTQYEVPLVRFATNPWPSKSTTPNSLCGYVTLALLKGLGEPFGQYLMP